MNTNDFEAFKVPKENIFEDLYAKHKEMFLAFMKIEGVDNWEEYNFSIDVPEDQMRLKDFLQIRFIEELTEATVDMHNHQHFLEEITDAFNFFLTAYVCLDKKFEWINSPVKFTEENLTSVLNDKKTLFSDLYEVVESVGKVCNLLKNRPWAQSNYLVDLIIFDKELESLWFRFNMFINNLNIDLAYLYEMWSKKYQVNMFRIRTGY